MRGIVLLAFKRTHGTMNTCNTGGYDAKRQLRTVKKSCVINVELYAVMTTLFITHTDCLRHDPGPGHPESPARLQAVMEVLSAPEFAALTRLEAPFGTLEQITRIHPANYVDHMLAQVPENEVVWLDSETYLSPGSGLAILRTVGGVCAAVDAVVTGTANNAICALRPCGHHAEPERAMGFCIFNGAAIAAAHAREVHGLQRVAVVDFDVHHGNGTQAALRGKEGYFYASAHQSPLYPGTGSRNDNVPGHIRNVPIPRKTIGARYRVLVERELFPELVAFQPELIILSAGFDAHWRDPLAELRLNNQDFAWLTRRLMEVAQASAGGRIVSLLEGGYDLEALRSATAAHVRTLMQPDLPDGT